jgi:sec-independent protein translocase protein TatB
MQSGEIVVIALLALVVLGPKRLPELARKVGGWTAELRQAARDITRGLESEVADLKDVRNELKAPLNEMKKPFTEIKNEMGDLSKGHEWVGPKPVSGPTPEDAMRDLEEMNQKAAPEVEPDSESPPTPGTSPNSD